MNARRLIMSVDSLEQPGMPRAQSFDHSVSAHLTVSSLERIQPSTNAQAPSAITNLRRLFIVSPRCTLIMPAYAWEGRPGASEGFGRLAANGRSESPIRSIQSALKRSFHSTYDW